MREMWDARYSQSEYAYGEEPNTFFSQQLSKLENGRLLLPAEGEGRNAVFAAKKGWKVDAFDFSKSAKEKAVKLADKNRVIINYDVCSFEDFEADDGSYDCISLTFVHLKEKERKNLHNKLIKYLSAGGTLIFEGFSKNQKNNNTGGPKDASILFSIEELKSDFKDLTIKMLIEEDTILNEGKFHKGKASVIRLLATKPH